MDFLARFRQAVPSDHDLEGKNSAKGRELVELCTAEWGLSGSQVTIKTLSAVKNVGPRFGGSPVSLDSTVRIGFVTGETEKIPAYRNVCRKFVARNGGSVLLVTRADGDWRPLVLVVGSRIMPPTVTDAIVNSLPGIELDEVHASVPEVIAAPIDGGVSARHWLVTYGGGADYPGDVEGTSYGFALSISNGRQISVGDTVVCFRSVKNAGVTGVFGHGRVSIRSESAGRGTVDLVDFERYDPVISLDEVGDPRPGNGNSITSVTREWFDKLVECAGGADHPAVEVRTLTLVRIRERLVEQQLVFDDAVLRACLAAIRNGKHLLLLGAPGTGKTSLAVVLSEVAAECDWCDGHDLVTATADWTSIDTVGGYRLDRMGALTFTPGQVLRSIDADRWLVLDELNRADMDKAIGQLFTVLSGQEVVLPYVEERNGQFAPPSIVPAGMDESKAPVDTHVHRISSRWRIIATMNERDRDLLFELSHALLRRFAMVRIPLPNEKLWSELLERWRTGEPRIDDAVRSLVESCDLGPAIIEDLVEFLDRWIEEKGGLVDLTTALRYAFDAYVMAQVDPVDVGRLREAFLSSLTYPPGPDDIQEFGSP